MRACGCGFDDVSFPHDCFPISTRDEKKKMKMTKETIYVVVGLDGCDLHVEKAFDNAEKAIEYAEECSAISNEGHNRREYGFSVLKRELMRWSEK